MAPDTDLSSVEMRLTEAAERGETLEVILVLRGKVDRPQRGRWRLRLAGRRVLTFEAGTVLATTRLAPPGRRGR